MSEKKNIKRNKNRISNEHFKQFGRKGQIHITLYFPGENYLNWLVANGLL